MATEEKPQPGMERDFSKVVLTLDNVLVPEDKLQPSPSITDGLDVDTEMDLKILGCELIQTSGILLKLPQVAMATGQVLFQRFYCAKSFVKHNMEVIAMACINLASKIEEAPRRLRDVINVFHHIKQVRSGKTISPLILNQDYVNLKNQVIKGERRVLKELGFCVHVKHPHKMIVMYLQVLEAEQNQHLVQYAWNYMNDSFRTDAFVRFHPETIACACIFLAARVIGYPLPSSPPWYALFHADLADMTTIANNILKLYKRKKPNADKLEHTVNECKKVHIEAKKKARGLTEGGTPNSRAVSPHTDSPNNVIKKLKAEADRHSDSSAGFNNNRGRGSHSRSRSRTPRSITNSRSYHSSSRSRSRSPHYRRHRHRSPKSRSHKSKRSRDVDKYDRYKSDKYDYDSKYSKKHSSKRRSASYSPSPRRSYSRSPDGRRHKKKDRYRSRSRSPYTSHKSKKSKKHSNGHRSRSRDRHRR